MQDTSDINTRLKKKVKLSDPHDTLRECHEILSPSNNVTTAILKAGLHIAKGNSLAPNEEEEEAEDTGLHYTETDDRKFREFFGCGPLVAAKLWTGITTIELSTIIDDGGTIQHMLWALFLMKKYNSEAVMARICGADAKTIRKWVWPFIGAIADLDGTVVSMTCRL